MHQALQSGWRRLSKTDELFVFAVTLIGGAMRFAWLGRPTLWNDEAQTYWRVCGSHQALLDILRGDGFGPLHYELTWLIGRVFTLTPFWMRFTPALCGTLMIPAVYWLAWEFFDRRVARLAAVFACCSAFLMVYSRDAKMYMQSWLAVTLFAACLLSYVRTRQWSIAAVGWVAGSVAMWLHATGFVVVPLTLLVVLIDRRVRARTAMCLTLGALTMLVGPLWYFTAFNGLVPSMTLGGGMGLRGVGWVTVRTAGHTGPALLADTAGAFMYAFSWIDEKTVHATRIAGLMVLDALLMSILLWHVVVAALLPRKDGRPQMRLRATPVLLAVWGVLPVYAMFRASGFQGLSLTDTVRAVASVGGVGTLLAGMAAFAATLWIAPRRPVQASAIALALLLSAVVIAMSVVRAIVLDVDFSMPSPQWLSSTTLPSAVPGVAIAILLAAAWSRAGNTFAERRRGVGPAVLVAAVLVGGMAAVDLFVPRHSPGSVWMPRYMGFAFPALLITAAALTLRLRPAGLRWSVVGLLVTVNLTQASARIFVDSDPPIDRVAADVLSPDARAGTTLVYTRPASEIGGPTATGSIVNSVGRYYLYTQSGKPVSPSIFFQLPIALRMTWSPQEVIDDAARTPTATRVVVWDRLPYSVAIEDVADSHTLPPPWRRVSEVRYSVRTFWHWGTLYVYRRSEYERP